MSNPPKPKPFPHDFEDLEFSIEQEEWNEYELKDGATVKGRVFLTKIMRNPYDPKDMKFSFSIPVWAVYAPASMRGPPDKRPPEEIASERKTDPKYEVHVNRNHEPWNVYRILRTGQKLKIKLTIDEVYRYTDKFDGLGLPLYNVPSGIAVNISGQQIQKTEGP